MRKRNNNKYTRKLLRYREKQLQDYLDRFLNRFDPQQPEDDKSNFQLLLNLRWLVYDFIYLRLKLNPNWQKKQWFLDLFDVEQIRIENGNVELIGDMVWWAEGKDAENEWWQADHEPHWVGRYKKKMRGDLSGGYWVIERVSANLKKAEVEGRRAGYEIEFGRGSTYMNIKSK